MPYRRHSRRSPYLLPVLAAAVLLFTAALGAAAQEPVLVADVETTGQGWQEDVECVILCPPPPISRGSHPEQLTPVGDLLFFTAFEFDGGRELWVNDEISGLTRRVADLCPGPCDSNPVLFGGLGGELFFWASEQDVSEGPDPFGAFFLSDGTAAGTRRLDAVCDGPCVLERRGPGLRFGDSLYFLGPSTADSGGLSVLWRTDGTAAGTAPLRYKPNPAAAPATIPMRFLQAEVAVVGDELYLTRNPALSTQQRSTLLRLAPGEDLARPLLRTCHRYDLSPQDFRPAPGGVAFVSGCLDRQGLRVSEPSLFLTDGTAAGTRLLFDGRRSLSKTLRPVPLGWWHDLLFFAANDAGGKGGELWLSEGESDRTYRIFDGLPAVHSGFVHGERVLLQSSELNLMTYHPDEPGRPREIAPAGIRDLTVLGRHLLFSAVDEAGREPWASDGSAAGTRRLADLNPGPADSNPQGFAAGDRVYFSADDGVHHQELWALPRAVVDPDFCLTGGDTLCLADGRFAVRVHFRNQHAGGAAGVGKAVPGTPKAGFFWFFRRHNLELMVKVLDGTSVNGHHWVFYGGITDLEYDLEVTDLASGETRTYHHAAGDLCGGADTRAFPATALDGAMTAARAAPVAAPDGRLPSPLTPPPCGGSDTRLCIGGAWQSFAVTATYRNQYADGAEGPALAVPMGGDSGWFWFFDDSNPEVMVKILNGTPVNGHYWVFIGGLSTVEYEVTVTDNLDSDYPSKTYRKPAGSTCGIADVTAFPDF